jgi:uncharacterized membrane protein
MSQTREEARRKMRAELDAIVKRNREAFEGEFAEELAALQGLSSDALDAISPKVATATAYASLMDVVRAASRKNLSAAELRARIQALGKTAVAIAKLVPKLAALFV